MKPIDRLLSIMATLRSDHGCPWDREQSLETLKPYLLEESYEVLDAIDSGDRDQLAEELGDVLLQIVFQSQICSEAGEFTFDDVATHIADKLERRHPHVFGDLNVADSDEVLRNWDAIKRKEKGDKPRSAVSGIPRHMPALHKAHEVQKRAARAGFDWDEVAGALAKVEEELLEVREAIAAQDSEAIRGEIGDLLFSVVNVSRFQKVMAEEALNHTVARFSNRFKQVEERVHQQGHEMNQLSLAELDVIWEDVKKNEDAGSAPHA